MKRITAAFLTVAFLASDVAYAAPAVDYGGAIHESPLQRIIDDPSQFNPALDFSSLKDVHRGDCLGAMNCTPTLILHIQDAHSNLSGQKNLAATLKDLMTQYSISTVLVEGAWSDVTLDPLKEAIPAKDLPRISKSLLMEGEIAGEEYLNLTSNHPMKLLGVEDKDLYFQSVQNYGALADKREAALRYLGLVQRSVDKLKKKLYPQELIEYEKAEDNVEQRLKALLKLSDSLDAYPALQKLKALQDKESQIDFPKANLEQAALLEELSQKGAVQGLEDSLKKLERSKDSKLSQLALVRSVLEAAQEKHIDLHKYPDLTQYKDYLAGFMDIDLEGVLDEQTALEDQVYGSVLRGTNSQDALLLRSIDRYLGLLLTAYKIQMTTQDFRMFTVNEPDFATPAYLAFINRKLAEEGFLEDLIAYEPILEEAQRALSDFYDSVDKRDMAFMWNTERLLKEHKTKAAVLITGGYHTQHLSELFKEKGYSYVVLTPQVTQETNQKKYEASLLSIIRQESKKVRTVQGESKPDKSLGALDGDLSFANKRAGIREGAFAARLAMGKVAASRLGITPKDLQVLGARFRAMEKNPGFTSALEFMPGQATPTAARAPLELQRPPAERSDGGRLADQTGEKLPETISPAAYEVFKKKIKNPNKVDLTGGPHTQELLRLGLIDRAGNVPSKILEEWHLAGSDSFLESLPTDPNDPNAAEQFMDQLQSFIQRSAPKGSFLLESLRDVSAAGRTRDWIYDGEINKYQIVVPGQDTPLFKVYFSLVDDQELIENEQTKNGNLQILYKGPEKRIPLLVVKPSGRATLYLAKPIVNQGMVQHHLVYTTFDPNNFWTRSFDLLPVGARLAGALPNDLIQAAEKEGLIIKFYTGVLEESAEFPRLTKEEMSRVASWSGDPNDPYNIGRDGVVAFVKKKEGLVPIGIQGILYDEESVYADGLYVDEAYRKSKIQTATRLRDILLTYLKNKGFRSFQIGQDDLVGIEKTVEAQGFHKAWVKKLQKLNGSVKSIQYFKDDPQLIRSITIDLGNFSPLLPVKPDSPSAAARLAVSVEDAGSPADEALRKYLPNLVRRDMDVADMGAAHGQRAVVSAKRGANVDAIEVHEPTLAVARTRFEKLSPEIRERIRPVLSDLFENSDIRDKRYDLIVFAPPRLNESEPAPADDDEGWLRIIEDPGFRLLERFLRQAELHLKPGGKILVAYGYEDIEDPVDGHIRHGGPKTLARVAGEGWDIKRVFSQPDELFGIYEISRAADVHTSRVGAQLANLEFVNILPVADFGDQNASRLPVKNHPIIPHVKSVRERIVSGNLLGKIQRVWSGQVMFDFVYNFLLDIFGKGGEHPFSPTGEIVRNPYGHYFKPSFLLTWVPRTRVVLREAFREAINLGSEAWNSSSISSIVFLSKTTASVWPFLSTRRTTPSTANGNLENNITFSLIKLFKKGLIPPVSYNSNYTTPIGPDFVAPVGARLAAANEPSSLNAVIAPHLIHANYDKANIPAEYSEIDPAITAIMAKLNELPLQTTESCSGHVPHGIGAVILHELGDRFKSFKTFETDHLRGTAQAFLSPLSLLLGVMIIVPLYAGHMTTRRINLFFKPAHLDDSEPYFAMRETAEWKKRGNLLDELSKISFELDGYHFKAVQEVYDETDPEIKKLHGIGKNHIIRMVGPKFLIPTAEIYATFWNKANTIVDKYLEDFLIDQGRTTVAARLAVSAKEISSNVVTWIFTLETIARNEQEDWGPRQAAITALGQSYPALIQQGKDVSLTILETIARNEQEAWRLRQDAFEYFKIAAKNQHYNQISGHQKALDDRMAHAMGQKIDEFREIEQAIHSSLPSVTLTKAAADQLDLTRVYDQKDIPVKTFPELLGYLETVGLVPEQGDRIVHPLSMEPGLSARILSAVVSGDLSVSIKGKASQTIPIKVLLGQKPLDFGDQLIVDASASATAARLAATAVAPAHSVNPFTVTSVDDRAPVPAEIMQFESIFRDQGSSKGELERQALQRLTSPDFMVRKIIANTIAGFHSIPGTNRKLEIEPKKILQEIRSPSMAQTETQRRDTRYALLWSAAYLVDSIAGPERSQSADYRKSFAVELVSQMENEIRENGSAKVGFEEEQLMDWIDKKLQSEKLGLLEFFRLIIQRSKLTGESDRHYWLAQAVETIFSPSHPKERVAAIARAVYRTEYQDRSIGYRDLTREIQLFTSRSFKGKLNVRIYVDGLNKSQAQDWGSSDRARGYHYRDLNGDDVLRFAEVFSIGEIPHATLEMNYANADPATVYLNSLSAVKVSKPITSAKFHPHVYSIFLNNFLKDYFKDRQFQVEHIDQNFIIHILPVVSPTSVIDKISQVSAGGRLAAGNERFRGFRRWIGQAIKSVKESSAKPTQSTDPDFMVMGRRRFIKLATTAAVAVNRNPQAVEKLLSNLPDTVIVKKADVASLLTSFLDKYGSSHGVNRIARMRHLIQLNAPTSIIFQQMKMNAAGFMQGSIFIPNSEELELVASFMDPTGILKVVTDRTWARGNYRLPEDSEELRQAIKQSRKNPAMQPLMQKYQAAMQQDQSGVVRSPSESDDVLMEMLWRDYLKVYARSKELPKEKEALSKSGPIQEDPLGLDEIARYFGNQILDNAMDFLGGDWTRSLDLYGDLLSSLQVSGGIGRFSHADISTLRPQEIEQWAKRLHRKLTGKEIIPKVELDQLENKLNKAYEALSEIRQGPKSDERKTKTIPEKNIAVVSPVRSIAQLVASHAKKSDVRLFFSGIGMKRPFGYMEWADSIGPLQVSLTPNEENLFKPFLVDISGISQAPWKTFVVSFSKGSNPNEIENRLLNAVFQYIGYILASQSETGARLAEENREGVRGNLPAGQAGREEVGRFTTVFGARLVQKFLSNLDELKDERSDAHKYLRQLIALSLPSRGFIHKTPFYFQEVGSNGILTREVFEDRDKVIVQFFDDSQSPDRAFDQIEFGLKDLENLRNELLTTSEKPVVASEKRGTVDKISASLDPLRLKQTDLLFRTQKQSTGLAYRAATDFMVRLGEVLDLEAPQYRLIDIDQILSRVPESIRPAYAQVLLERYQALQNRAASDSPGVLQNVSFGFAGGEIYGFKSEIIPASDKIRFVYEADANTLTSEQADAAWKGFFESRGRAGRAIPIFGVSPLDIPITHDNNVPILPTEGGTVLNVLLQRIDLDKAKAASINISQIQQGLDRLMRLFVNKIDGATTLNLEDIQAIQRYREGFTYLNLAIRALERLDLEQFFRYSELALAVGAAA